MRTYPLPDTPAPSVVRVSLDHGRRTAIVLEHGTRWSQLVVADAPVRVVRIPVDELDARCAPLELRGSEYPVARAARILKRMHRAHGGTTSAMRWLRVLVGDATSSTLPRTGPLRISAPRRAA